MIKIKKKILVVIGIFIIFITGVVVFTNLNLKKNKIEKAELIQSLSGIKSESDISEYLKNEVYIEIKTDGTWEQVGESELYENEDSIYTRISPRIKKDVTEERDLTQQF